MKNKIRSILKSTPIINQIYGRILLRVKYGMEMKLIENKLALISSRTSVLHFSMNKAATQHVKRVLKKIAGQNQLIPISIHDYAFHTGFPFLDQLSHQEMEQYQYLFKPNSVMYSVFGGMIENIKGIENYKVVLSIRDPRDILVSSFFSVKYSHVEPLKLSNKSKHFANKRQSVKDQTIDEFVIEQAPKVFSLYENYKARLLDLYDNTVLIKYEDMVSDYPNWLDDLVKELDLDLSHEVRGEIIKEFENKRSTKENVKSHMRRGVAGDYKEKLSTETIDKINEDYSDTLRTFGYAL